MADDDEEVLEDAGVGNITDDDEAEEEGSEEGVGGAHSSYGSPPINVDPDPLVDPATYTA